MEDNIVRCANCGESIQVVYEHGNFPTIEHECKRQTDIMIADVEGEKKVAIPSLEERFEKTNLLLKLNAALSLIIMFVLVIVAIIKWPVVLSVLGL